MNDHPLPSVCHITTFSTTKGGMQSHLRRHLRVEQAQGACARLIALFSEPKLEGLSADSYRCLKGFWATNIVRLRQKFKVCIQSDSPTVCIYHNMWGVPFMHDIDAAQRRIGFLHTDLTRQEGWIEDNLRHLDGVIVVHEALKATLMACCPLYPEDRICILNLPLAESFQHEPMPHPQREMGPILKLGYAGRMNADEKRLDRFDVFYHALNDSGIDYTFDFLGDGPLFTKLKNRYISDSRIRFHGWKEGEAYAHILSTWDFQISFSDFEGSPLSIAEGMFQGVFPLMPDFYPAEQTLWGRLHPYLVYPLGNMPQAVAQLKLFLEIPYLERDQLRSSMIKFVQKERSPDHYWSAYNHFVARISALPPLHVSNARYFRLSDLLPMCIVRRIFKSALYR
jgi:glycosyltransferase involved in cell wall biosynthesis